MFTTSEAHPQAKPSRLDGISFIILQAILFLTPIFFVPMLSVPFQVGKSAFLIYGVIALLLLWLVARLKDGLFAVPKSLFYASAGLLAVVYSIAGLLSGNKAVSFAGQGFEVGTVAFLVPSLILFALVPLILRSKERIFYSYATLLASFFVVGVFHVIRIVFGADVLSFGMFSGATANLIGRWSDVGVFFGLATIISLITLEKVVLNRLFKVLVNVCFALSLAMIAVVNFSVIWVMLAIVSLVLFVYQFSFGKRDGSSVRAMPYYALITLVISVFFVFVGARVGGMISDALGTSQVDVRPSLSATLDVTKGALVENLFFGTGPNRFSSEWLLGKPAGINQTLFWNVDFNYGIGFVPSFAVTSGVVGALAILLMVVLFVLSAGRVLFRDGASPFSRYLVISSFMGASYLWALSFVSVPSTSIWILTVFISGLFVASLREDGIVSDSSIETLHKPAANFVSVLLVIFCFIGTLYFGYSVATRLIASVYFQKAVVSASLEGDVDKTEAYLVKAVSIAPSDLYSRAVSQLYLSRIGILLNDSEVEKAEAQRLFQQYLSVAIQASNDAIALDPTNYANHASLGQVFEAVIPLKIEGAYEGAKQAYEEALAVNPANPELYLMLARVEVAKGDNEAARSQIRKALELKGDYSEAVYLLAQIQIAEKNVPEAIRSVEAIATISPSDSGVFFQLGLLYYDQKRYPEAVLAFERAVLINPEYANAKYLLGMSYVQTKETAKALEQFKALQASNPDNADIEAIITDLEKGAVQKAPKGTLPTLPVSESSTRENI
jgi:tetratricopeptide (TPR) repeat protein